ncbi:MAG TPA: hypothetical protein VFG23_21525, partial [Polyangia bacterium]|nr:hypothetical protein [Polyangia bacterium]
MSTASVDGPSESQLGVGAALIEAAISPVRGIFSYIGEHAMLLGVALAALFRKPFRLRLFLEQMEFVGVGSLTIII